jgi:predicted alpha/beta hydrolase
MYEQPAQPRSPGLWLGLSIGATILCCWPLAIPGIVFAAQAMQAQGRGDIYRWENRVNLARVWTLWSIGLTVGFLALVIGAGLLGYLDD